MPLPVSSHLGSWISRRVAGILRSRTVVALFAIAVVSLFALWELLLQDVAGRLLATIGIDPSKAAKPLDMLWGALVAAAAFAIPLSWIIHRNDALEATRATLHAREREFRAFAEAGSDWLWETDAELRITRLFGGNIERYPIVWQSVLGRRLPETGAARQIDGKPAGDAFQADLAARRPFRDLEYEARLEDGRTLVLSSSGVPLYGEDGRFEGYRGTTRDVTAARDAERARRHSERRFADFAAAASDSFWEIDEAFRFTYISGNFEERVGRLSSDFLGKTREEIVGAEEIARHPAAWRTLRETMNRHEPFREFEYEFDFGSGKPRVGRISGIPIFDDTGAFKGYRGVAADITEQRKVERQMVRTLNRFRLVADNMPILIAHLDAEARFLFVNRKAEEWFARPRHRIVGATVREILGDEACAEIEPVLARVIAGEELRLEQTIEHPDGKTRTMDCVWVPDRQTSGDSNFFGLMIDVSDQRELEAQLRQNQKMDALGKLTGGIAHDFNNLLLAIQGNVEFLREEVGDPSLQRHANNALRGVGRAAELTRRLLAFSRRQPLTPQSVDVGHLVRDMEDLLRGSIEEIVDIRIETAPRPAVALVDPGQLENAILNLAINARDAMPDGGRLTLRVGHCDDSCQGAEAADGRCHVRIEVADTGCGMPEHIRAQAFDPFFTTKEVGRGTGLGLSMVHGFVEQSGGIAEIESEIGQGTTIRLSLPSPDDAAAVEREPVERGPLGGVVAPAHEAEPPTEPALPLD